MGDLQLCADTVFLAQGTSVCVWGGGGGGEGTIKWVWGGRRKKEGLV